MRATKEKTNGADDFVASSQLDSTAFDEINLHTPIQNIPEQKAQRGILRVAHRQFPLRRIPGPTLHIKNCGLGITRLLFAQRKKEPICEAKL